MGRRSYGRDVWTHPSTAKEFHCDPISAILNLSEKLTRGLEGKFVPPNHMRLKSNSPKVCIDSISELNGIVEDVVILNNIINDICEEVSRKQWINARRSLDSGLNLGNDRVSVVYGTGLDFVSTTDSEGVIITPIIDTGITPTYTTTSGRLNVNGYTPHYFPDWLTQAVSIEIQQNLNGTTSIEDTGVPIPTALREL